MNQPFYLGVDLGGTQLRMAVVNERGDLASEVLSVATGREFRPQDFTREVGRLGRELQLTSEGMEVVALGVGTPGVIVEQTITQSDNLPLLNGANLRALASLALDIPIAVENDARCFALAEARYGAGRGSRSMCGLTLGTGVGCGVIIGGEIYRGANSAAGEVYRIPLRGFHLEHFLSGPGVVRSYLAAGGRLPEGIALVDGALISELAREGNESARAAWGAFAEHLHFACECLISVLDPELIVVGGSIAQSRDLFGPQLDRRFQGRPTRIAYARLGTAAGVIGAAALNIRS